MGSSEWCWLRQPREPESAESFRPVSEDSLLAESQLCPLGETVPPHAAAGSDLTGVYGSSGSERESLLRRAGHADKEVQAGADRDVAAAD